MVLVKTGDATIIEVIKSDSDQIDEKKARRALADVKSSTQKKTAEELSEVSDPEIQ